MADILMQQPNDNLATGLYFVGAAVDVANPVECLLWRRNVVSHRRKQNDGRFDVAQVEGFSALCPGFTRPQLVADEQVLCNPLDFFTVHQEKPAPPALELQKAWRLGIDI